MRFCLITLLLAEAVFGSSRKPRDIGLHQNHQHDHHVHHEHARHHIDPTAAASQPLGAASKGYGRETPNPPLSVDLELPEGLKTSKSASLPQDRQHQGYPREDPSISFQYPAATGGLNAQASFKEKNADEDSTGVGHQHQESTGGEIPGEAGKDFPVFATVPLTSFDCRSQQWPGYYVDEEARCQVFHICYDNRKDSFLCPNGTLFHQKYLVCDWWYNVDCAASKNFFQLNSQIGVVPEKPAGFNDQPIREQVSHTELNLASQQPVVSLNQQEPNLSYLPPQHSPPVSESKGTPEVVDSIPHHSINNLQPSQNYLPPGPLPVRTEPRFTEASSVLPQSALELSQSYLPPLHEQAQNPVDSLSLLSTVPETVAPIEHGSPDVIAPGTFYLPPAAPEQAAKIPDLLAAAVFQEKTATPAVAPSLGYLPPKETETKSAGSTVSGILQVQLPTGLANIPTAMEALANGILKIPETHHTISDHNVAKPSTDYLPPAF